MKRLIITLILCYPILLFSQDRFWVGSGNWSNTANWSATSGGTGGATVPTTANDIFLDGNSSGTVTLDVDGNAASLSFAGTSGLTFTGSAARTLNINGSLALDANVTNTYLGQIVFAGALGGNITSAGILIQSNLIFNGTGTWALQDNLLTNKDITVDNGQLIVNGQILTTGELGSNATNAMTIDISNSEVHLSKILQGASNMTINAANSALYLDGASPELRDINNQTLHKVIYSDVNALGEINNSANSSFQSIEFLGNGEINGSHTIDTLLTHEGKTISLGAGETQDVLDIVAIGGCSNFITINSTVDGSQANISKVSGALVLQQVNLQDINAIGGAAFTANNSIDVDNNTGWTINIGRDIYWVGGSGNWDDTMHWSTTSGGTPGACSPGEFDNVYFDVNSFTEGSSTVTLTGAQDGECHDMDWSAATNSPVFWLTSSSSDIFVHGSLFLNPDLNIHQFITIFMESTDAGESVLSNGYIYDQSILFQGTGEWNLLDDMDGSRIAHTNGTLNTNSHTVNMLNWTGAAAATVDIGSSDIIINGSSSAGFSYNSGAQITQNNSHIYIQNTNGVVNVYNTQLNYIEYSQLGSLRGSNTGIDSIIAHQDFTISAPADSISWMDLRGNANLFQNFEVDTLLLAPGKYYTMSGNNTININDSLRAVSSCADGYLQIRGSNGSHTINAPFSIEVDYVRLENITATGAIPFTANNSVDMGGNTDWTINSTGTRTLYWVGGPDNWEWNDTDNWSLASGGATGECVPWLTDNVIFDDNSFTTVDDNVIVDRDDAYFHDMTWLNTSGNHILRHSGGSGSRIFQTGSLELSPYMQAGNNSVFNWEFISTEASETIQTNEAVFNLQILIKGTATYNQLDNITNAQTITIYEGASYNTNNHNINVSAMSARASSTLDLGTSTITSNCSTSFSSNNLTADQSTIIINSGSCSFNSITHNAFGTVLFPTGGSLSGPECTFNLVEFSAAGTTSGGNNGTQINTLTFLDNGTINGTANSFGTLNFTPSKLYRFTRGPIADTINIWNATSTCALGYIDIQSSSPGSQATVYSANNQTLDIVRLRDMAVAADSPGIFTASNSVDNLNNTGWVFNSTPRTLYWVGGTGVFSDSQHWSLTSGGTGGECVPTLLDDVYFDANSFTAASQSMRIDEASSVNSMIWEGVTNTPTWQLSQASTHNLTLYGSLVLDNAMDYQYRSNLTFIGASPEMDSLKTDNVNLHNNIRLFGSGTYNLIDSLKNHFSSSVGDLTINDDVIFNGSNNYISSRNIYINDNSTINIENSLVDVKPAFTGRFSLQTNTTLFADNSTINILGFNGGVSAATHDFYNVNFKNPSMSTAQQGGSLNCTTCTFNTIRLDHGSSINGNNTMDSLYFSPGYTYTFQTLRTTTINNFWQASGDCNNDNLSTINGSSSGNQATINAVNFKPQVSDAKISNLLAASPTAANLPFNASGSYDLGNNTNWDFSSTATTRDLYWVGGTGDWYDGSHWSLTSGGAGGECPPFGPDNVFFDVNSFTALNQSVTVNSKAFCNNMDWSGSGVHTPNFQKNRAIDVFGSLTFVAGVNTSGGGQAMIFRGDDTESIITGGVDLNFHLTFMGSGTWNLHDNILMDGYILNINEGTVNTNDNDIFLLDLTASSAGPKTLNLGNSVIHATRNINLSSNALTLDSGTSTILFEGTSFSTLTVGSGHTFNNVEFNSTRTGTINGTDAIFNNVVFLQNGNLNGDNTFNTLTFSAPKTYTLQFLKTQTILTNLIANGTCDDRIILQSNSLSAGNEATIIKDGAAINLESIDINNVFASGTAAFNAFNATGINAVGWNIVNGDDAILYWVGGDGAWDDRSHWSYTSGGNGGACEPGQNNSVVFDGNSFSAVGQTVNITSNALCNSMTWSSGMSPILDGNPLQDIQIYGSFELEPGMDFAFAGDIFFESLTTGNTIFSAGHILAGSQVIFQGIGGEWSLLDDMRITNDLLLRNGILDINDNDIVFEELISQNSTPRSLLLGNGQIVVTGEGDVWDLNPANLTFNAGMSHIYFTGNNVDFDPNSNFTYYDITLNKDIANITLRGQTGGTTRIINSDGVTFNNVTFLCNGEIFGGHTYNDFTFTPSFSYILESGEVQTINGAFNIQGTSGNRVTITSTTPGTTGVFAPATGPECFRWLDLTDNEIQGFTYGAGNSVDGGGNVNWDFASALCTALPIELTYFIAELVNDDVQLKWETASEINNDYFTIERSVDGFNWEGVLEVDGVGNSTVSNAYVEWDNNPYFGTSYYRLKQTDFDRTTTYSHVETIIIEAGEEVKIYPNPVKDMLVIEGKNVDLNSLEIYSIDGQRQVIEKEQVGGHIQVDMALLAQGVYILKLNNKTYKIVKQ